MVGNFIGAAEEPDRPSSRFSSANRDDLQAVVDPYARADFSSPLHPKGRARRGYLTFTALPRMCWQRFGNMKAQFGKVPRCIRTRFPDRYAAAQQESAWRRRRAERFGHLGFEADTNPVLFLEATGEIYQGNNDLFTSHKRSNLAYVGRLRGYRDVTESTNLDVGTSVAYGHNDVGPDAKTRVLGVDATFRYRPLRRAIYQRFIGRTDCSEPARPEFDTPASHSAPTCVDYVLAAWFAGARTFSDRADDASLRDKTVVCSDLLRANHSHGAVPRRRFAEGVRRRFCSSSFSIGRTAPRVLGVIRKTPLRGVRYFARRPRRLAQTLNVVRPPRPASIASKW